VEGTWFSGLADELARCFTDAEACAETCERLLDTLAGADDDVQRRVVDAVVAPAAIARVLIDLIDHPPQLVLAACRLFRDSSGHAVRELELLGERVDSTDALAALRRAEASCAGVLDAAG